MIKRKIIGAVIGLVIIICSIIAIVYFKTLADLPEENITTDPALKYLSEDEVIFSGDILNLDYLQIINKYGDYKVRMDESGKVRIVGRESADLLPYSSAGLYNSIKSVKCEAVIELDSQNLEQFGLAAPAATVTARMKDGSETTFYIGNQEPMGQGYYIRMQNNTSVYLVANLYGERYLSSFISLYETKISKEITFTNFTSFSLKKSDGQEIFVRATNEAESKDIAFINGVVLEKPFYFGASSDMVTTILDATKALQASSIATDELINDELRVKYGFDNPTTVVIDGYVDTASAQTSSGLVNPYYGATSDGSPLAVTSTYILGKTEENSIYVMYDNSPVIYVVDASTFSFVNTDLYQYCQRLVNLRFLNELDGVTVEYDDQSYSFDIQDPDAGEDMVVTYNYARLKESLFRKFYANIISVSHTGIDAKPDGKSVLKITYEGIDGKDTVLEFIQYPDDPRKVYMLVDGEGHFTVMMTKVEKIINDMHKLIRGEDIL